MKIAIVNDSFLHIGGAEKVVLELIALYPQADFFCPIINEQLKNKITQKTTGKVFSTVASNIPFFYSNASLLKPLLIFYWQKLNLNKYDLVISSSHSFNSKLINTPKKCIHISYVYTPPRYLDTNFNEMTFIKSNIGEIIFSPLMRWLKKKDLESANKPDLLIAISKTIQKRIKNRYQKKSLVIYPPVNTSKKIVKNNNNKYFVCFSRLVKQKGIDLAVKTCTQYNLPLVVVGTGPEMKNLKMIAGPTVSFKGYVPSSKLKKIFANAKALINCAIEEDFGMVTVEAAGMGLPVIGYKSGGIEETLLDEKTGVFFETHTVESLITSIKKFEKINFNPKDSHEFAKKFSIQIFRKKIKAVVNYYTNK